MILMCVLVLAVHSSFQPYKKKRVNVVESLYLVVLCVLAVMQVLQKADIANNVCSTLLIIASLHACILTVSKAARFFQQRFSCSCSKQWHKRRSYGSTEHNQFQESLDEEQKAHNAILDTIFNNSADN